LTVATIQFKVYNPESGLTLELEVEIYSVGIVKALYTICSAHTMLLPHCNFCGFVNLLPCQENLKARCEAPKAAKATERKQQAEARCLEEEAKQHAEEERQAREKQECHTWKHPSALTLRRPWNRSKRQHNSRPGLVRRLTGQVPPPKGQSRMLLRPY